MKENNIKSKNTQLWLTPEIDAIRNFHLDGIVNMTRKPEIGKYNCAQSRRFKMVIWYTTIYSNPVQKCVLRGVHIFRLLNSLRDSDCVIV